jgi:predicted dehydrogenase
MVKVRWGVLGTARIATVHVIPALQRAHNAEVVAIASRDMDHAMSTAQSLGIAKAFGAYDDLLADPGVDAVYIPLPNDLHVPMSIRALAAGKHVLCEKPLAMTADEAQSLLDEARNYPKLKIMEAFMYRFHPQWQRARQLVGDGAVGELRTIQSFFSYSNLDRANIRNQVERGGGGLMDIGCYNVSYSRFILGQEPRRVIGIVEYDPDFGADRLASGMLEFAGGTASFTCSTQLQAYQRVNIFGTTGRIEVEIPVNAPADQPCRLWYAHDSTVEEVAFEISNQYTLQGEALSRAILDDRPVPTPLADAVANMRVLEAIVRSSQEGRWIEM